MRLNKLLAGILMLNVALGLPSMASAEEDYFTTIAKYNQEIMANPNAAANYDSRGNAYLMLNDYDNAIKDFKKALEITPDNTEYKYHLALANYRRITDPKSKVHWGNVTSYVIYPMEKVVKELSTNSSYYTLLGDACWFHSINNNYNDYTKNGIAAYTKALSLDKNLKAVYKNRADLYIKINDYVNAIVDCNQYIELCPEDYRGFQNRAKCYQAMKQFDKAKLDFARVIVANPQADWAYVERAQCLFDAGSLPEAKADLERAIQFNPNNKKAQELMQQVNIKLSN